MADGAVIGWRVSIDLVEGLLENGVCCDLLTAGVNKVITASSPADERLKLRPGMAGKIVGLVGLLRCIELGVYDG